RAVGQSQRGARYAGISVNRTIIKTMLIAGAFGGLAGAVQIAGLRFQLTDIYTPDTTGFDAIAVSLLGQNSGIGVVLSGILFAGLDVGRNVMQSGANVSKNLADILQALILFSIAANFLRSLRLRLPSLRNVRGSQSQVEPGVAAVATDIAPGATVDARQSGGSPGE
ncbi:MAG: ABC transporter permease subunit, partial [Ktedonobacterales bacterium]